MSFYHCGNGHHVPACTGYKGALDDYVCLCKCHGEWDEKGRRPDPRGDTSATRPVVPDSVKL